MKIIEAIQKYEIQPSDVRVFLGGGITNCIDWQKIVISKLKEFDIENPSILDDLVIFNPRRENFPINDPDASFQQISWEFENLEIMDIFTMRFDKGPSDQPICLYELGRNIIRMQQKFPFDWKQRIVISCDPEYRRASDVLIQSALAFNSYDKGSSNELILLQSSDLDEYVKCIINAYKNARSYKISIV